MKRTKLSANEATLETGSILVTYDDHFARIPGLRLWDEIGR